MIDLERHHRPNRAINLVAMINIIFLLLIFFMIAGTVEKFEILQVDPPQAKSGKLLDEGPVKIILGRYEEVLFNDELVSAEQVPALLSAQLKDNPNKVISLKADAALDATKLIATLDQIKAAGGRNVSLETQSMAASSSGNTQATYNTQAASNAQGAAP